MSRLSRTGCSQVPHYIIQQSNRGEDVFLADEDRLAYLGWLTEYAAKFKVEILAYCLMTNQIHLVAVPTAQQGLQQVLKPLHMRYAQRFNRQQGWKDHVWSGRCGSGHVGNQGATLMKRFVGKFRIAFFPVHRQEHYPQ